MRKSLERYRLVTLVGPGGAGKTRLAAEVGAELRDDTTGDAPDGIWIVELASVTDASDVPKAVLGSVGLRETRLLAEGTGSQRITSRDARTRLLEGLADVRALLVLDNCEHLIDACAHLADALLAHSPMLRILATSREPLGVTGESLFVVPPLGEDPAVRLFADRAAAVSPDFTVDGATRPLVSDIVTRLDGLPLAIELAAARLRTLPLAEVSRRLADRFRLLTGGSRTALPRHRTLRAVVEWSWELLTPAERLLAMRFSVFPAGATTDAVATVCASKAGADGELAADEVDELLSSLVDKSLLAAARGRDAAADAGDDPRVRGREAGRARRGRRVEAAARRALHRADARCRAPAADPRPAELAGAGAGRTRQHPGRAALLVRCRGGGQRPQPGDRAQRHGAAARRRRGHRRMDGRGPRRAGGRGPRPAGHRRGGAHRDQRPEPGGGGRARGRRGPSWPHRAAGRC